MTALLSGLDRALSGWPTLASALDSFGSKLLPQRNAAATGCGQDHVICYTQCEGCSCGGGPCFGFNCEMNNWSPSSTACANNQISKLSWTGNCCF